MMPGQSAIGNPRILTPHIPTPQERIETTLRHLALSCAADMYVQEHINTWTGVLPQPTYKELTERATRIQQHADDPKVQALRTPVEFRKYLFSYISGIPGNKALKVEIAKIREYKPLVELLQSMPLE